MSYNSTGALHNDCQAAESLDNSPGDILLLLSIYESELKYNISKYILLWGNKGCEVNIFKGLKCFFSFSFFSFSILNKARRYITYAYDHLKTNKPTVIR